jgi:hypothetical protein
MPEKRTEIVTYRGGLRAVPKYHPLAKANRTLLWLLMLLMVLVMISGFFLAPDTALLSIGKKDTDKLNELEMNPAISAEVNALKSQMIGMVSGSIETKLRTLEESVKLGSTEHSLVAIEDLKNDIKVLRAYSETPKKQEVVVSNAQLAQEVTHLKKLIYIILASCGLMFVAATGIWVKFRRLPYRELKSYLDRNL